MNLEEMFAPKASPEHALMTNLILERAKDLSRDRVPQASEKTIMVWAETLAPFYVKFHPTVWPDAVSVWATEMTGPRMISPKDLIAAATTVTKRRLETPEGRAMLEQRRQDRADWLAGDQ